MCLIAIILKVSYNRHMWQDFLAQYVTYILFVIYLYLYVLYNCYKLYIILPYEGYSSNVIDWFLAHLAFRPCELLSSLFVRRSSVNISHFNLLLRNHWANCNQTLVEWSLDGPLSNLCPVIPTSNQDGRQAKNRKKGGWNFNCPLLL